MDPIVLLSGGGKKSIGVGKTKVSDIGYTRNDMGIRMIRNHPLTRYTPTVMVYRGLYRP